MFRELVVQAIPIVYIERLHENIAHLISIPICGNSLDKKTNQLWFKGPVAVLGILPARIMPRSK